jgi:predicted RNase H-like nuclease
MRRIAGIDGCKNGWVVWSVCDGRHRVEMVPSLAQVDFSVCRIVAIDMPMGLPDIPTAGGREAEIEVRKRLGQKRKTSVFSAPSRAALTAFGSLPKTEAVFKALVDKKSLNLQSFYLLDKICELDTALVDSATRKIVCEVHPEYAFALMQKGTGIAAKKSDAAGAEERIALLEKQGFPAALLRAGLRGAKHDDVVDAAACCWIAQGIARGEGHSLPSDPSTDSKGIRMAIWGRGATPPALTVPRKWGGNNGRQISSAAR